VTRELRRGDHCGMSVVRATCECSGNTCSYVRQTLAKVGNAGGAIGGTSNRAGLTLSGH